MFGFGYWWNVLFCKHELETVNKVRHTWELGYLYTVYHCRCTKCGYIKGVKVK